MKTKADELAIDAWFKKHPSVEVIGEHLERERILKITMRNASGATLVRMEPLDILMGYGVSLNVVPVLNSMFAEISKATHSL